VAECQRCGAQNRDHALSCSICGAALDPEAPRPSRPRDPGTTGADSSGGTSDTLITRIPVFDVKDLQSEPPPPTGRHVRPSSIIEADDAEEDDRTSVQLVRRVPETAAHALIGPLRTQRARRRSILFGVAAAAVLIGAGFGTYLFNRPGAGPTPEKQPAAAPDASRQTGSDPALEFIEPQPPGETIPEGAAAEQEFPGVPDPPIENGPAPSNADQPLAGSSAPLEPSVPRPGRPLPPRSQADAHLDRAGRALSAGSIVDPPGGSAFDHLSAARRLDPGNPEIDSMLRVATERLRQQIAPLRAQGRYQEAIQTLDRALALFPRLQELRTLQSSLRVEELLASAQDALERERLVAPPQQSALYYIDQVLMLDPNNEAARAQEQQLKSGLAEQIQTLKEQRRQGEAEALLDAALQIRPNDAELVRLRAALREPPAPAMAKAPPAPSREPPPTTFELPSGPKTAPETPLHRPKIPTSVGRNCSAEMFTQAAAGGPLVGLWRDSPIGPGNSCIMIHDPELPMLKAYDFDNRPSAFCVSGGVVAELYPDSNYSGNCRLVVAGPYCVNDMKRVSKCDGGHWGDVLSSVRVRFQAAGSPGILEH